MDHSATADQMLPKVALIEEESATLGAYARARIATAVEQGIPCPARPEQSEVFAGQLRESGGRCRHGCAPRGHSLVSYVTIFALWRVAGGPRGLPGRP